jgi:hypothetical protein
MAKADNSDLNGTEGIDRRRLLTAAVATTAGSVFPKVATTEDVCESIACIPSPVIRSPKLSAAMARRLLEISRRNELRRQAELPLLSIPNELRRMKQQEELEAFRKFEAANGREVWDQVLADRRQAEGNSNWRPNWMEGLHYQNRVHAALRARFEAKRESAKYLSELRQLAQEQVRALADQRSP